MQSAQISYGCLPGGFICKRRKCICTPHPLHASPAVAAADCGCNVLVEKPLASSLEDCDAIIAAEKRNHVTVGTIHIPVLCSVW